MKKLVLVAFGAVAAVVVVASATAQNTNLDGLSPQELLPLARKEGRVVVYSFTSRIARVETAFEAAYPGIDMVSVDVNSTQQIARIKAEQAARNYQVDVAYISDAPVVFGDLIAKGMLQKYIPPSMEAKLAPQHKTPLMSQRLSTKVLMYNSSNHPNGSPVKNLWELTQPQWRGKVVMVDPTLRGDYLDFLTELTLRSSDMARAHQALFNASVPAGVNAGEKFIRDLYTNGVILVRNTDAVNDAIGKKGQLSAPIGISTYSDVRDNTSTNRALALANEVSPSPGIVFPAYLGLVKNAKNQAAARLLMTFMMGDNSPTGGSAFAPFYVPGDYATRSDIRPHPDAIPFNDFRAWRINPTRTFAARQKVADLILTLR